MSVNMAYVPKPVPRAKVLKITTPGNGTVDMALNPEP